MRVGELVDGRFQTERLAGSGAMGAVYRATDDRSGNAVALKTLRDVSPLHVDRFAREARALAELEHPHVVGYVAHGVHRGEPYLAMEWLDGEDLAARLTSGPIAPKESLGIATAVARALSAAHARGITHRDIKPSNIFLIHEGGGVKVLDFGIARVARMGIAKTATGMTMGTPGYMAPEQARGDPTAGPASDVFSLGCVLFECLAGRPAFEGVHPVALLAKVLLEEPPRLLDVRPDLPIQMGALLGRVLAKEPGRRPSAEDVADELEELTQSVGQWGAAAPPQPAVGLLERRVMAIAIIESKRPEAGADSEESSATMPAATTLLESDRDAVALRVGDVVRDVGASVNTLADGAIVISFREGGAATDLARLAARCCLAVRGLLTHRSIAFAVGAGETSSRSPLGPAVDRASSVLAQALRVEGDPACVLVDDVAAGLLGPEFEVSRERGVLVLHGMTPEPSLGVRTLLGRATPCVGRELELRTLLGLFEASVEDSVSRVVLATAPPGIGKSRLRLEFQRRIEEDVRRAVVWTGRADPMGAGSPFGVLAEALRDAIGIAEGETIERRRERITEHVRRIAPEEDRERLRLFLGELVGTPFPSEGHDQLFAARRDPRLIGDQMRRAWEDFVALECEAHPVVLVLEDLHWGDAPSLSFVESALRVLGDRRFFVLGLARPEVHEAFPNLWMERDVQELRLRELTPRASAELVRACLPSASAKEVQDIGARAGGNAFYLEEVIRAVAEGRGDRLPETALAMAQARLEAFDQESRRILRAASIFGETFWSGGVAHLVLDLTASEVRRLLERLDRTEAIMRRRNARFPGEEEYVFRHALVREAAYGLLTADDMAAGHRLAGEWLEGVGEGSAVALAEHFELGLDAERAVRWWLRAGQDALQGADLAGVQHCVARGLGAGGSSSARAQLLSLGAEAHLWRGENEEAVAKVEAATLLPDVDHATWIRTRRQLVSAFVGLGNYGKVVELGQALMAVESSPSLAGAIAEGLASAAAALWYAGDSDAALRFTHALESLTRTAPSDVRVAFFFHKSLTAQFTVKGDISECLGVTTLSIAEAETMGDIRSAWIQRANLASTLKNLGQLEQAEIELRAALAQAERTGATAGMVVILGNLGWTLARTGRIPEGITLLGRAIELSVAHKAVRLESASRTYLATILAEKGEPSAAVDEAQIALDCAPDKSAEFYSRAALALAQLKLGLAHEALVNTRKALTLLEVMGTVEEFEFQLHLAHVEALLATGDREAARLHADASRQKLLAQCERLPDPEIRRSFRTRIGEHARLLELAAELTGSPIEPGP